MRRRSVGAVRGRWRGARRAHRRTDPDRRTFRHPRSIGSRLRDLARGRRALVALLVIVGAFSAAIVLAVARPEMLPAKFSFDGRVIQHLAQGRGAVAPDRSYSNTAAMYRALGLQDAPVLVAVITVVLFATLVLVALVSRGCGGLSLRGVALGSVSLLLGSVYLGTYSKDAPVLVISAALLLLGRNKRAELLLLTVVAGYGLLFRTYWLLILVVFLGIRALVAVWPRRRAWPLAATAAIALIGVAFAVVLGHPADYYRVSVNDLRLGDVDSRTMLRPFVDVPEPFGGVVNVLLTFGALFVPIPLLLLGSGYYLAIFGLIVTIWAAFWWSLLRPVPERRDSSGRYRAAAFLVAFVSVQAFFEPDYGSALRHLTPLLPVLLFVVLHGRRRSDGVAATRRSQRFRRLATPEAVTVEATLRRRAAARARSA